MSSRIVKVVVRNGRLETEYPLDLPDGLEGVVYVLDRFATSPMNGDVLPKVVSILRAAAEVTTELDPSGNGSHDSIHETITDLLDNAADLIEAEVPKSQEQLAAEAALILSLPKFKASSSQLLADELEADEFRRRAEAIQGNGTHPVVAEVTWK